MRDSRIGNLESGEGMSASGPWPSILGLLSDLTSDGLVEVVSRAGVAIDLALTSAESFSHKPRITAYLPRVQKAYSELPETQRLGVLCAIAAELVRRAQPDAQGVNSVLPRGG